VLGYLRATAILRIAYMLSPSSVCLPVCPSVCLVCQTVKNGWS